MLDTIDNKPQLSQFKADIMKSEISEFRYIDLFAGIGGIRLGFDKAGGECVFSSEWNNHCRKAYWENFNEMPHGDINEIDPASVPQHEILTAGFPCQPFSISGKQKGFEDTRGTLIYKVLEIISHSHPKVVFLENVKHLVHHDKGKTLKIILENLKKLGYTVNWKILNATDFGVPQNRERIIIIGSLSKKQFNFSELKKSKTLALKYFLKKEDDFEYIDEPYTLIDNPKQQKSGLIFAGYRNKAMRVNGTRPNTEHLSRVHKQPNRIYSTDGVHPTLSSQETSGRFWILHHGKVRKLTIDECFRIMGFPESYIKTSSRAELYKQIGNSVCVPMVMSIAEQIKKQFLEKSYCD